MTYRPTPEGLARDIATLLHVLSVARSNLDRRDGTYTPIRTGYPDLPPQITNSGPTERNQQQ